MIIAETLEIITSGPRHLGEAILTYDENPLRGTDYDNDVSLNSNTTAGISTYISQTGL